MSFEANGHFRIESLKSFKGIKQLNPFRNSKINPMFFFCFLPLLLLMAQINDGMGADKDMGDRKMFTITKRKHRPGSRS